MSVVSFASLKGGVGKTSLAVNVAHAFAQRGCQTLVIDLDPPGHCSRLLLRSSHRSKDGVTIPSVSPLAQLFLADDLEKTIRESGSLVDDAADRGVEIVTEVRERVDLCTAGPELRHFLWGRGARLFKTHFRQLISELSGYYDHIIIDTSPDFNVLTRNALAVAELVVVPVDSSEMSIFCLEELVTNSAHIKGPIWAIARSMVSRNASRIHRMSTERLEQHLSLTRETDSDHEEDEELEELHSSMEDTEQFLSFLHDREHTERVPAQKSKEEGESPIYLLNSLIHRTEQQNRLTFVGKTAFDLRGTQKLAFEYTQLTKELEQLLGAVSVHDEDVSLSSDMVMPLAELFP